jgi:hypothetical protein
MARGTDNNQLKLAAKTRWRWRQQFVDEDEDDDDDDDDKHNEHNDDDDDDDDDDDEHNDSDSDSGWRQRQRLQQRWPGAQTTINYNWQQRLGGGGDSDGNSSCGRSNDCCGHANDCPGHWRRWNCLHQRLGGLWMLVVTVVCGVVRAGCCVCAARPCCFVRGSRAKVHQKFDKPQHSWDRQKARDETSQSITFN